MLLGFIFEALDLQNLNDITDDDWNPENVMFAWNTQGCYYDQLWIVTLCEQQLPLLSTAVNFRTPPIIMFPNGQMKIEELFGFIASELLIGFSPFSRIS